ncbi:glycosyltransferase family 4 protein [Leptothoe spongobia]|uniref:Glycosyltransferase family 4 protein n=1 Tax=Leptothoe spongobia TAU-MAC 1115 TaxID=1967444 RepID=A0A947GL84_9CYAN|nr:glycosyltransferase family 1 protein [Leptothoe spongobia]MBT9317293.1 glycosyltransferase family 4 protein [Leptothoe spongobia TAU-MAC 1115]
MHILISALHRPLKPTGVCRHAVNLAQCLVSTGRVNSVSLVVGEWQKLYFEELFNLDSKEIQLVSVDIKNNSFSRNFWLMFGLPKLAKQLRPDLIHMSFPLPIIRQLYKVPIVSTIHDLYPYECPENFGYPQVLFNQLFLRQCISGSDGLACVSRCTLETLENHFSFVKKQNKTEVIYNAIDFANIKSKAPDCLVDSLTDSFLLNVAQHRKNKNLDLLIQAYSVLITQDKIQPKTKLLLIGNTGPETNYLERLVQTLDLDEQVMFISGIEDGELRWLYEHALVFVMPSSNEGFCLPLVEALILNCPVVCSDISIFREVGSSHCRYIDLYKNPVLNLSSAIAASLNEGALDSAYTESRFSKNNIAHQLLDFYTSIQTV